MRNIIRYVVYVALVYMLFSSDAILIDLVRGFANIIGHEWTQALSANIAPGILSWFLAGCFLNFCVRASFELPNACLVVSWIIILCPYVLTGLVAEGLVNISTTIFTIDPMPAVLLCLAYITGFTTINRIAQR